MDLKTFQKLELKVLEGLQVPKRCAAIKSFLECMQAARKCQCCAAITRYQTVLTCCTDTQCCNTARVICDARTMPYAPTRVVRAA
eukprot:821303-Rhodomonas_salina.1